MAKRLEGEAREEYLRKLDRRLSRLFLVLFVLVLIIVAIVAIASRDLFAAGVVLASILNGLFFLVGLVAWIRMGDLGIVPTGRMFLFFLLTSIVGALLFTLIAFFVGIGDTYNG
jgi:uncharacterized membrane protein